MRFYISFHHLNLTDRQMNRQTDRQADRQTGKGRNAPVAHVEASAGGEPGDERKPSSCCCHDNQVSTGTKHTWMWAQESSAQTMVQLLKLHTSLWRQTPFTQVMRDAESGPENEQKATPYYLLHDNYFIKFMYQIHKAFSSAFCRAYCDRCFRNCGFWASSRTHASNQQRKKVNWQNSKHLLQLKMHQNQQCFSSKPYNAANKQAISGFKRKLVG